MCGKVVNQLCLPGAGPNQRLSSAVNSDYAQSPEAASRSDPHHCASDNHRRRSARDNRKRDRDLPHPGRSGGCVPHRPTRPRCLRLSRASSLHWYLRKETKKVLRLSSERESSSLLRSGIRRADQIAFGIRSAKSCRFQYGRGVHGPARELISADRDIVSSNKSDSVNLTRLLLLRLYGIFLYVLPTCIGLGRSYKSCESCLSTVLRCSITSLKLIK